MAVLLQYIAKISNNGFTNEETSTIIDRICDYIKIIADSGERIDKYVIQSRAYRHCISLLSRISINTSQFSLHFRCLAYDHLVSY